jgi:hypothetical protein
MNAKRASLAGMLAEAPETPPPLPRRPESQAPDVRTPEAQSTDVRSPEKRTPEVRTPRVRRPAARAEPFVPALPKYKRLDRKELLIWPDQITDLGLLSRRLNRARGGAGERLTQNTLIRVAVALLLSRQAELGGTTEEELRRSLGLPE